MADEIGRVIASDRLLERMSDAAVRHVSTQTWERRVRDAYGVIGERLGWQRPGTRHA
jgi:hypothetical protein